MLQALDINCILNNSNVKHPEWSTTTTKKIPRLDSSGFDLSLFFLSSYCVYLCKDTTWWTNASYKLQGCPGERLSTRKKNWAEKFSSRLGLPSRRHCIVYCIWNCRLSIYCIYYQPPPALKPAAKTKLWTISKKRKKKNTVVQSELKCFQWIQGFI